MSTAAPVPGSGDPDWPGPGHLALEVRRLADRLRSLPQSRIALRLDPDPALPAGLRAVRPEEANRAGLARALAQYLADAALGIEGAQAPLAPVSRRVPALGMFAVGDQVGVTGTDLAAALRGLRADTPVWTPEGTRGTAGEVLAACLAAVAAVRAVV